MACTVPVGSPCENQSDRTSQNGVMGSGTDDGVCTCNTGGVCFANGDCCGSSCDTASGKCACEPLGQVCAQNADCCTGQCNLAAPGSGFSAACCVPTGQTCASQNDCCSRICDPTSFTCD